MPKSFPRVAVCLLVVSGAEAALAQVAVMGEARSGMVVYKNDVPDPASAVAKAARAKRPNGNWKMLLTSAEPGHGAAFCVRDGSEVHFFVTHGKGTRIEALKTAEAMAKPHAATTRKIPPYICGAWKSAGAK